MWIIESLHDIDRHLVGIVITSASGVPGGGRFCPRAKLVQIRGRNALHYNQSVKTWDVVIVGGGVIGLVTGVALATSCERARRRQGRAGTRSQLCRRRHDRALRSALPPAAMISSTSQRRDVSRVCARTDGRGGRVARLCATAGTICVFRGGELPSCHGARVFDRRRARWLEPESQLRGRPTGFPSAASIHVVWAARW